MLMHMRCAVTRFAGTGALAFLCGAALMLPVLANDEPGTTLQPQKIPERLLLPREEPDAAADRKEILGDLYQRLSESRDAESARVVTSAIEQLWQRSGSDTVDLLMGRADKLIEVKDLDIAMQILDSIVEIAPAYSEGWNKRAFVLFGKKEFGEALENLRRALAIDPSHYKAIQGLGFIMLELGDKKAALRAFRHVLKVHPHLEDAQQSEKELAREVEGQGI